MVQPILSYQRRMDRRVIFRLLVALRVGRIKQLYAAAPRAQDVIRRRRHWHVFGSHCGITTELVAKCEIYPVVE